MSEWTDLVRKVKRENPSMAFGDGLKKAKKIYRR